MINGKNAAGNVCSVYFYFEMAEARILDFRKRSRPA